MRLLTFRTQKIVNSYLGWRKRLQYSYSRNKKNFKRFCNTLEKFKVLQNIYIK